MAKTDLPSPETLRQLLRYEPETGKLFWLERPETIFKNNGQSPKQSAATWNSRFANKPALASPDKRGYLTGRLLYHRVKAHRVILALAFNAWPIGEIDHINGDPADNRLANLRVVSHKENGRNLKRKATNKSGHCGVWRRPSGRWLAKIMVDGRDLTIGTFDTIEMAVAARKSAEQQYGFHPNHGSAR